MMEIEVVSFFLPERKRESESEGEREITPSK